MKKIIREVDEERSIVQVTVADERWYLTQTEDKQTGLPIYLPVPSVTWIASYWPKGVGFYKWLANKGWDEAESIKQEAGEKGSAVHLAVEMILKGEEFRIDTEIVDRAKTTEGNLVTRSLSLEELIGVQSFIDWRKEVEKEWSIESLAIEKVLISEEMGCGGTVDWVVRLTNKETKDQKIVVIDFKTGNNVWMSYHVQLNTYKQMLQNGENPIFELDENGTRTKEIIDMSNAEMAVLQLGYPRNKKGFKYTEIPEDKELYPTAKLIWERENKGSNAGFSVRNFPLVLSEAVEQVEVEDDDVLDEEVIDDDVEVEEVKPKKKAVKKGKK